MVVERQQSRPRVKCSTRFSIMQRDLEQDNGHFFGLGSEKKWYSISADSPQGELDKLAEKMMFEFAESGCPIFRATSPLPRSQLKSKGGGKLSIHCCADLETIQTSFFAQLFL